MNAKYLLLLIGGFMMAATMGCEQPAPTPEGVVNLKRLGDGAKAYAAAGHPGAPTGKVDLTPPPGICCRQGGKCQPDPHVFADPTWTDLAFTIAEPFRFSYSYESADGKTFTATATADLACDGKLTTYTLHGDCTKPGTCTTTLEH